MERKFEAPGPGTWALDTTHNPQQWCDDSLQYSNLAWTAERLS